MSHIAIHEEAFKFLYLSNNALKKENQRLQKENKILKKFSTKSIRNHLKNLNEQKN